MTSTTPGSWNPDLIQVARQARTLTQGELAREAGLAQSYLSKLENGLVPPTAETIDQIANALQLPATFFSQPDRIVGLPVSVHAMYRKKARVGKRALHTLQAELNIRLMHLRRLIRSVDLEPELSLPYLDIDEFAGGAAEIARLVRRMWLVPNGPLKNLTDLMERAGIVVIPCDFSSVDVDGVTIAFPGLPPCCFMDASAPADRMRMSLAHELGHVIMHRIPSPEMEDEANAFAAELLMPARDLKSALSGKLSLNRLARLKPVWKVSMQALLVQAGRLGAITSGQSQYLWRQINARGIRLREPPETEFPREKPVVLNELLRVHIEDLGYSLGDLSSALHLHPEELSRWYQIPFEGPAADYLRVVK